MRTFLAAALFMLAGLIPIGASAVPEGSGIMYGGGYAFTLDAPKGWVLDNSVAQRQGVCAVFYPGGSSWEDSPVVFYVNTREITATIRTAADVARDDVETYHQKGSPGSKAEELKKIAAKSGRTASVWQYTGDRWGNYERSAFFVEPGIINEVVMSARSKLEMEKAIPAFEQLVSSYVFIGKFKVTK